MRRICSNCRTPLTGRKGHGFVRGFVKGRSSGRVVCGRSKVDKPVTTRDGIRMITVPTPGCRA